MFRKVIVAVMMMCVACGTAVAGVPQLLNYQGKLNGADGAPIEGKVTVGFGFYKASADGIPLYSEQQTVLCAKGIFHVLIGNGSNPQGAFSDIYAGDSVYLEITVDPGGVAQALSPRQRIGSVVFALKAGTTEGMAELAAAVATLQAQMGQQQTNVAELQDRLQHVSRDGDDITISGANLHIVNGTGTTDGDVNGLGNLIVGYNEQRGSGDDRSGSHNIVVGCRHNFTSYGGLVAGCENTVSGICSSVSGGYQNTASGNYTSVSGGYSNTASGLRASISGGRGNKASGGDASVSGGFDNMASGHLASVAGGANNTGSAMYASVSGGRDNTASGNYSSVGGGNQNTASAQYASVSGGLANTASGDNASVSGGRHNIASGHWSSVAGGGGDAVTDGNQAFANYASASSGFTLRV